jgi:adenosine deaminase
VKKIFILYGRSLRVDKTKFIQALNNDSHEEMKKISKSDLHNHAGRGGSHSFIEKLLKIKITPLSERLKSVKEMDVWFKENIKNHFPDKNGWIQRLAAAFIQAETDNITVLSLSYEVSEVNYMGGIDIFIAVIDGLHKAFAPNTIFLPDLSLVNSNDANSLDEIFGKNWFKGIDIINYSDKPYSEKMSMNDMKAMCRKAREYNLITKAHVGEFDGADDVMRYAEELELNQIQHGVAAAESPQIMNWLATHKIQLNICPTSNIMLNNTKSYETHQIRKLFDYGVPVTLNTDDLLIFNATVSQEYLNLFNAGLMTADELNIIRETGLLSANL